MVRLALRRPYTFVVVALLMLILGGWFITQTRKDIFPDVNIPVVSVIWTYAGLSAEEFDQRITTYSEYSLSGNVNDIERMESQTLNGIGVIRLYFHPNVEIEAAVAQATAVSQAILRRMPAGIQPPIILRYSANSVPVIQISLSSETLTEQELYDYGIFRIRQAISVIQGTTLPAPYGGKVRQVMVDLDPVALQAKGLSPRDVNDAINAQILTQPTGDVKIGDIDYRVNSNSTPELIESMNAIPIKVIDNVIVYLRDIGHAHDGFVPQTNIVRSGGHRSVLLTLLKNGPSSTLDIVNRVWDMLPSIRAAAPKGMNINLLFDQSIFVRAAIKGVVTEGVLAAFLTGAMILIFLGSWRSTLIVLVSIPLSILTSIICLSLIGETLNVMTLGGLALAIGILVDDATVTIENIHRNMALGKPLEHAILDGSYQIAIPAFVSTLSICIVFTPVVLLVGPSRFLFVPFAFAVVFAVSASYFLSRTLVPVMIKFMLGSEMHLYTGGGDKQRSFLERYQARFEEHFLQFRRRYTVMLNWSLHNRGTILIIFALIFLSALLLAPGVGRDFFPRVDARQFRLHVKVPSGTRIEVTEEIFGKVEDEIKKVVPEEEIALMIDNIGLPSVAYNLAFGDNATVGTYDGEILVSLKSERQESTPVYMDRLRSHLKQHFPNLVFFFQPADMVSQILNFGLPTPIDVRVIGYNKAENLKIARELVERISHVPGATDVHLHQIVDAPELFLDVDRTLLARTGINQRDLMNDVLISYSDSTVVTPNYWLDRKAGIPYLITVQTPKYRVNTVEEMMRMPVSSPLTKEAQLLSNLASVERRNTVDVTNHVNVQPVFDIYANVSGRDLGGVATDIQKIIDELQPRMTPGNKIELQGMVTNMEQAFLRLGIGFIFAILLVYFIMVINFQSWLDPFIIILALPGAVSGIIWMLYLTHTTFSVPSLMGTIMSLGVATANSILIVTFANLQLKEGKGSLPSMRTAGATRLRPVLMTALAMIVGMIPMAFGMGEGGEQNAPLGRAVIGGLAMATLTTLFFVPVVFTYLRKKPNPYLYDEPATYKPPKHLETDILEENAEDNT
ncbi:MAG: efflux RND transporter permease subunit [Parachlamydia sp.]|nr:efflux RND transporter permease subunit [Parachlamydia sp.]